jgi:hypothetical protein
VCAFQIVLSLIELGKANGNNLWRDSIDKELQQINGYQTFRRLKKGEQLSAAYQRIPYFIDKFDGRRRKARLVANGVDVIWMRKMFTRVWSEGKRFDVVSSLPR